MEMESVELNIVTNDWKQNVSDKMELGNIGDMSNGIENTEMQTNGSGSNNQLENEKNQAEETATNKDRPESSTKTIQKLKLSWAKGTKNLSRQTASLFNTVETWTTHIIKHDKMEDQAEVDKYFGIIEKKGNLAQKMKTLLKICDEEKSKEDEHVTVADTDVHKEDL